MHERCSNETTMLDKPRHLYSVVFLYLSFGRVLGIYRQARKLSQGTIEGMVWTSDKEFFAVYHTRIHAAHCSFIWLLGKDKGL